MTMALTGAERTQRWRERKRSGLAGGPWLFPELTPATPPKPEPKTTPAQRAASRESSRRHNERKRIEREAVAPAPPCDPDRPDVPGLIAWLESRLKVSQGRRAGEAFEILPWQREFLTAALAPGKFDAALSMARGNGKSTFLAAVIAAAIAPNGPLRQPRGEVLLVASSFQQARVVFEHLRFFLDPFIAARVLDWKIEDSSQRAAITHKPTGARVRCIASDPRRAHGLAPYFCVLDEPAQWPPNTGGRMLAALETAAGKVPGSRRWMIGTRPDDPAHWFARALAGGADVAMSYAGDIEDPHNPNEWARANPSLSWMPDLQLVIEAESEKAKRDPDRLASFKALRLNGGVADVQHRALLEADVWARIEADDTEESEDFVLGVDLGGGAAMSAFSRYDMRTGRLDSIAAFPSQPGLRGRGISDGVDRLYERMAERGELFQCGEHAVDLVEVLSVIRERWGLPSAIGADRWKLADLREAIERNRWPHRPDSVQCPIIFRGMGFQDGGADVSSFRRACLEGYVKPVPNLLLRAAMREARTVADPARNEKLAKLSEGGRRQRARDDAAAASILAVAIGYRERKRREG